MAVERFTIRRGSSAEWAASTEILAQGEPGYDYEAKVFKIGDGSSLWSSLTGQVSWSSANLDNVADTATRAAVRPADAAALASNNVTSYVNQATTGSNGLVSLKDDGTNNAVVVQDGDSRLTDARDPTAHKTSHASGGSDALSASDIGAATSSDISSAVSVHSALTLAVHGIDDTSVLVLTDDTRLSDDRTPTAHVDTHKKSGSDELKLSDLGEVWLGTGGSAPSNGQVLAFDGTIWENQDNPVVAHAATTSIHVTDSPTLARKPNETLGASGEFKLISAGLGAALNAPSGGQWAYFICCFNGSGTLNLTTPFAVGVANGGDEIGAATATYKWTGFAYKI